MIKIMLLRLHILYECVSKNNVLRLFYMEQGQIKSMFQLEHTFSPANR